MKIIRYIFPSKKLKIHVVLVINDKYAIIIIITTKGNCSGSDDAITHNSTLRHCHHHRYY